tara:strand:- start:14 stop:268 length:255 start_codon:yes stop_codon:yes gene_type:complete
MHDLEPKDPEINYEGQMAMEYYWHDFFEKIVVPALFDDSPDREQIIKQLAEVDIPNELPKLAKLLKDKKKRKYICGNELCIYDF